MSEVHDYHIRPRPSETSFTVKVDAAGSHIVVDTFSNFNGVSHRLFRDVLDAREKATREALIALGWTPPGNGWRPIPKDPYARFEGTGVLWVAMFRADDPSTTYVIHARAGEHGALFFTDGSMLSVNEQGWVPFAWRVADAPARDDEAFPPMWTDYLTESHPCP
jgi:hypothetical protein